MRGCAHCPRASLADGYVRGCNLPFGLEIATFGIGFGDDSDSNPCARGRSEMPPCRIAACTFGDCGLRTQDVLRHSRRGKRWRRGSWTERRVRDVSVVCFADCGGLGEGKFELRGAHGRRSQAQPSSRLGKMGVSESEMRWNGTDKNWPSQIIEFVHPLTSTPNNSTPRTVTLHCPRHQQS